MSGLRPSVNRVFLMPQIEIEIPNIIILTMTDPGFFRSVSVTVSIVKFTLMHRMHSKPNLSIKRTMLGPVYTKRQ